MLPFQHRRACRARRLSVLIPQNLVASCHCLCHPLHRLWLLCMAVEELVASAVAIPASVCSLDTGQPGSNVVWQVLVQPSGRVDSGYCKLHIRSFHLQHGRSCRVRGCPVLMPFRLLLPLPLPVPPVPAPVAPISAGPRNMGCCRAKGNLQGINVSAHGQLRIISLHVSLAQQVRVLPACPQGCIMLCHCLPSLCQRLRLLSDAGPGSKGCCKHRAVFRASVLLHTASSACCSLISSMTGQRL